MACSPAQAFVFFFPVASVVHHKTKLWKGKWWAAETVHLLRSDQRFPACQTLISILRKTVVKFSDWQRSGHQPESIGFTHQRRLGDAKVSAKVKMGCCTFSTTAVWITLLGLEENASQKVRLRRQRTTWVSPCVEEPYIVVSLLGLQTGYCGSVHRSLDSKRPTGIVVLPRA